jgi:hypothetical protein
MNRGGQREEYAIQVGMDKIKSFEKSLLIRFGIRLVFLCFVAKRDSGHIVVHM